MTGAADRRHPEEPPRAGRRLRPEQPSLGADAQPGGWNLDRQRHRTHSTPIPNPRLRPRRPPARAGRSVGRSRPLAQPGPNRQGPGPGRDRRSHRRRLRRGRPSDCHRPGRHPGRSTRLPCRGDARSDRRPAAVPADGAAFGTPAQGTSQGELSAGGSSDSNSQTAGGQSQLLATIASNQIVKTGEIDLEVSDLDSALNQAQSTSRAWAGPSISRIGPVPTVTPRRRSPSACRSPNGMTL